MTDYTATVTREGAFWVIDVEGVGVTQARSAKEVERMAPALVVDLLEVDPADVTIRVVWQIPGATSNIRKLRTLKDDVARRNAQIGQAQREIVALLAAQGIRGNEIAAILGVSTQRVSQLAAGGAIRTEKPSRPRRRGQSA